MMRSASSRFTALRMASIFSSVRSSLSRDWLEPTWSRKDSPATCQMSWRNSDCQFSSVDCRNSQTYPSAPKTDEGSPWVVCSDVNATQPAIAWAIALGRLVLGESELGVRALALMAPLAAKDEMPKQDFAYLTDQVLVAEGKKQRYGTQLQLENGKLQPAPIEDPAHVDARRRSMGLGPLADYLKELEALQGLSR